MRNEWTVRKVGDGWQLARNGEPFIIRGAVAGGHLDALGEAGANALRLSARKSDLDRAAELGLAAMVNLPVRGERNGMDWGNPGQLAAQTAAVLAVVEEFRDHPAVMLWSVGNELDWIPPGKPHHPDLWRRLNDLARVVRRADPGHPICTVVGTGEFEEKIRDITRDCPDFDLLGINAYGDLGTVTDLTRKHWPKPYVIAEWGPTGHWQVPRTAWQAPLEETSTEKAQSTFRRYTEVILGDPHSCLGSFVFYWAEKQETTHTWYGLFRDGMKTESIDVMASFWTGNWPANRAPAVLGIRIAGHDDPRDVRLPPNAVREARVNCYDPDYDPLTITWDIRREVRIPADSYAGSLEKPEGPIPGLVLQTDGPGVRFRTPDSPGEYRLFVQVTDGNGHAGYANVPFLVEAG